ncbi:hypothetical protein MRX96_005356 [Rhipicephalus microplus]
MLFLLRVFPQRTSDQAGLFTTAHVTGEGVSGMAEQQCHQRHVRAAAHVVGRRSSRHDDRVARLKIRRSPCRQTSQESASKETPVTGRGTKQSPPSAGRSDDDTSRRGGGGHGFPGAARAFIDRGRHGDVTGSSSAPRRRELLVPALAARAALLDGSPREPPAVRPSPQRTTTPSAADQRARVVWPTGSD